MSQKIIFMLPSLVYSVFGNSIIFILNINIHILIGNGIIKHKIIKVINMQ